MGKTSVLSGWSHTYSWGPRLPGCFKFTMEVDVRATMVICIIILATSTPDLRSLGLGAAHHVVPWRRSMHSGLVQ
jgi:hypothetical protein